MPDVRVAVLIDGGFLRVEAKKAKRIYNPDYIERFALACKTADESLFRILYYDCALYSGTVKLPVSGLPHVFQSSDAWLHELSHKDLFAVRRGVLKFRGFKPKRTPVTNQAQLTDADFQPDFEQKGVDMRIGLDIAAYAANHAVERIVLVSNDTDCVPALKYGRRAGLQTVLIEPPKVRLAPELLSHIDFKRPVLWP
ncbi:NYN domain-containing protein [Tunturiibacter empetritectus]|uniref:Uncharacterized LabA/DUF88 family protein n=2 Tax=Tunturiibacter TaxID=3154218 RepID=A0A852VJZ6_9BACT|nr:NYN domain-containing protein [Edaphobacter lichenicola]NYF91960.1 uncharacterized LabA/DUF88 family protein [Edaphobacter lichenicola]